MKERRKKGRLKAWFQQNENLKCFSDDLCLPVQNTVKIHNPTLLIFLVSGFRYVSKRHGDCFWRGFGRIVPLVVRSRLCRTIRSAFSRHACCQLDWRILNRHLRRMAGQSSMEAFADYRFSRQPDDFFQLFAGNGYSDASATLGDGFFGGLPACFRLVPADGVGHLLGAKLEIAANIVISIKYFHSIPISKHTVSPQYALPASLICAGL